MLLEFAIFLYLFVNTASIILNKVVSDRLPKKKSVGLFYQSLACFIIAGFYFLFSQECSISLIIILVGLVNAAGNYFVWKSFSISLSKSALVFPLGDGLTIILAVILLKEAALWSPQLAIGVFLSFLAMFFFRTPKKWGEKTAKEWFLFALGMVLIFGTTSLLIKIYSSGYSQSNFLFSHYTGTLIGALILLRLEKVCSLVIPKKTILLSSLLGGLCLLTLFAVFWTYQLGGQISLIQPLRGLSITLIPALFGWLVFKERGFSKLEKLGFVFGIFGAVIIIFS